MSDRSTEENRKLLEKIRVLTCKFFIAQKAVDDVQSFDEKLQAIVDLFPQAFESPEQIAAKVCVDGKTYATKVFDSTNRQFRIPVHVKKDNRGFVEISLLDNRPNEGASKASLSDEENELMASASRKIAYMIEKREARERKKTLEDQLRHADRLATIGQLAAGIAHELNNPLGDILGFAQLASNSPDLAESVYQDLSKIVKSALYAREVIKRMLFFSRQAGVAKTEINLNQLIENWMDFFEFRCSQNNIEIALALEEKLPLVNGDPAQLNQVLINLVVNAIHAMPDGGTLTIETKGREERISMKVRDSGTGMSKEIQNKIFLPFFTTKEVDQGTGLGLSVVYGIVNEHGGSVNVKSLVGSGSTFEIELPL
jgi:two-component system NtrC family sensor kinase